MNLSGRPKVEPDAAKRAVARELYALQVALVDAGFTERQSLDVVGQVIRGVIEFGQPGEAQP